MLKSSIIGLVLVLAAANVPAQDMLVPVELQLSIFVKVLTFDRAVEESPDPELVIGVLYQSRVRESDVARDQMLSEVAEINAEIHGRRLRAVAISAGTPAALERALVHNKVDVLYLTPLRAVDISGYTAVTRRNAVLTVTGMPQFVIDGASVGVGLAGSRPKIIINSEAARMEGSRLQARLLKLAEIVS